MKLILATIVAVLLTGTTYAADLTTTTSIVPPQATYQFQPPPVQVQHRDFDRGPRGPGFEFRGPDVRVGPGPEVRFGGPEFHGRFLGFGRHFWHGSWYDYGVGPCWALGPDGRYWWVCD